MCGGAPIERPFGGIRGAMLARPTEKPRIVLAGGGHAHLHTLRRTASLSADGFSVTLVNPSPYLHYSGMATGTISGDYRPDAHRIDVRALAERGGGSFIEGRVERMEERHVVLEGGEQVPFDAASATLGSTTTVPDGLAAGARAAPRVFPTKPIEHLEELRGALLALDEPRVVVVGGGAAGCEVTANALALLRRHGKSGTVTLVESDASLLPQAPPGARRGIETSLRSRGAGVLTGSSVAAAEDGGLRTRAGRELPCDVVVLATGVAPPAHVFRASGLPVGEDGGLWVDASLRSLGNGRLFGGGDSISFRGTGLPKLGVFAIRQGPVIYHNLRAVLRDEPLREFRPRRHYLYVLNLGDGTGLAVYGALSWRGRLAYRLKHVIDTRFVARNE
jgi:NADH dehydrogenase FAD-containing subunit